MSSSHETRDKAEPRTLKVLYLAPADIQVARVDRQCIVAFCAALSELGVEVELVALQIEVLESEPQALHPLELYRIPKAFPVRLVRVPVQQNSSSWWIAVNRFLVHLALGAMRAARRSSVPIVLYEKSYAPALALLLLRPVLRAQPLVVFEAHLPPRTRLQRLVLRHANLVVANTHALAADLVSGGLTPARVLGTHQGIDVATADSPLTQAEARAQLGLEPEKRLAIYTGKIYTGYQEIDYILEAAKLLRRSDVDFLLVGGRQDHVDRLRQRVAEEGIENVVFTGFVPPTLVPSYQRAADLLLLYYPSGYELNAYRSPGKLFEYMAAERPIVAVDLPVLREVLGDEPAAVMVAPDSPRRLAEAIEGILRSPERAERLARSARRRVAEFTWAERARAVISAIEGLPQRPAQLSARTSGAGKNRDNMRIDQASRGAKVGGDHEVPGSKL